MTILRIRDLVTRIFNIVVNSVSLERSFLVINFIYNRTRNRLNTKRVDRLLFIYINIRTLRRKKSVSILPTNKPLENLKKARITSLLTLTVKEELGLKEEGRSL